MNWTAFKAGATGISAAILASLCCLVPLVVVLLGLGSGAFMIVTMRYRSIFLPVGVFGVGLGYYFYFQEKRRCRKAGCRFGGGWANLVFLCVATVIVALALGMEFFPQWTSDLLQTAVQAGNAS